jgi:hypothetical protein
MLREDYTIGAYDNRVLKIMFGHETKEVIREWREFHYNAHNSPYKSLS